MSVPLPLLTPSVPGLRYSCHGCGACCRDFTIELRETDFDALRRQGWEAELGGPFWTDFRGRRWLRQREDGACIFLQQDGRCRVHARHGLEAKPLACQLFPFSFSPGPERARVGVSFACSSVQRGMGAELSTHAADLRRMQAGIPEAMAPGEMPDLLRNVPGTAAEIEAVRAAIDGLLGNGDIAWSLRLAGFAWVAQSLRIANLDQVRGERLAELVTTLATAAPAEVPLLDAVEPSERSWRLLRQAVFARVEDPKLHELRRHGRLRTVLGQWRRSRAWARGHGLMPTVPGWPAVAFDRQRAVVMPGPGPEGDAVGEILVRWLRAALHGDRAWGAGLHGWPVFEGLGMTALNMLCAAWLMRAHAAGSGRDHVTLEDAQQAIGRIDRTASRAVWLGSTGEFLRLAWFCRGDHLRRIATTLFTGGSAGVFAGVSREG
ncbi:MAG: YkgJ family cysteine cluster protein [Planctomycetes bacterium]|nr:YkgJ family cysteine cluster protein [Planctomycetota bacterium]